ncbi:MAG: acyltransferase domain-containing protein [Planctomycetes bacterium]|nr:acyltransferase domain-containing protein [Planctomycetota bacterium]
MDSDSPRLIIPKPAIAATSLSMLRLLQAVGIEPAATAGHSFGEVIALHAAGAYDAATAMQVAIERGRLMAQAAAEPGAMLSVRASLEEVEAFLGPDAGVVVANHNGPRQVVLSGHTPAIEAVDAKLRESGLSTTRLDVATAFHSAVVAGAVEPLRAFLDFIRS